MQLSQALEGKISSPGCQCLAPILSVHLTAPCLQLTDEFAKQILPSCSGVEELWRNLTEAQQMVTASDTADVVNQALTTAVADIVDAEVPEALIREAALNEYQAQLLEMQSRVSLSPFL